VAVRVNDGGQEVDSSRLRGHRDCGNGAEDLTFKFSYLFILISFYFFGFYFYAAFCKYI
jgi:hypothetical protein